MTRFSRLRRCVFDVTVDTMRPDGTRRVIPIADARRTDHNAFKVTLVERTLDAVLNDVRT